MGPNKNVSTPKVNEELLIVSVEARPNLYDMSHANYHNYHVKDKSWEEIGEILKLPVDVCKLKWKYLRQNFRKAMLNRRKKKVEAAKKIKRWRLETQMEFLKPYVFPHSKDPHSNFPSSPLLDSQNVAKLERVNSMSSDDENDAAISSASEENEEESLSGKEGSSQSVAPRSAAEMSSGSSTSNQSSEQTLPIGSSADMLKLARAGDMSTTNCTSSGDHLTKYFQSIEETVRTLPSHFQIRLKSQISQLVHNAEYEASINSNCTSLPLQNYQFQQPPPLKLSSQPPQLPPQGQSHPQTPTSEPQHFQLHTSTPRSFTPNIAQHHIIPRQQWIDLMKSGEPA